MDYAYTLMCMHTHTYLYTYKTYKSVIWKRLGGMGGVEGGETGVEMM